MDADQRVGSVTGHMYCHTWMSHPVLCHSGISGDKAPRATQGQDIVAATSLMCRAGMAWWGRAVA